MQKHGNNRFPRGYCYKQLTDDLRQSMQQEIFYLTEASTTVCCHLILIDLAVTHKEAASLQPRTMCITRPTKQRKCLFAINLSDPKTTVLLE